MCLRSIGRLDAYNLKEDAAAFVGKRALISFLSWLDYCDQLIKEAQKVPRADPFWPLGAADIVIWLPLPGPVCRFVNSRMGVVCCGPLAVIATY